MGIVGNPSSKGSNSQQTLIPREGGRHGWRGTRLYGGEVGYLL